MGRKINFQFYEQEVSEIKKRGKEWGLTKEEINFAFEESFLYLRDKYPNLYSQQTNNLVNTNWINRYFSKLTVFILLIALVAYGLSYHKPTHNFVERNIQEIIYPFMKLYRRLTLPLVELYPSLSGLYDESCLLENPYFQVSNMDCWPCENIKFILNLTDSKHGTSHVGLPFIIKVNDNLVTLSEVQDVYDNHKEIFLKHAEKIQSSNDWTTINDLFSNDWMKYSDLHISCVAKKMTMQAGNIQDIGSSNKLLQRRINRMEPARILRHLLGLPKSVPNYSPSILIERYLIYDGSKSLPYPVPATEGANVFLKQLSGRRLIVLEPTTECFHSCQRLSILLQEQHILWYNWWYWRPLSLPVMNNTEGSLMLLGSTA